MAQTRRPLQAALTAAIILGVVFHTHGRFLVVEQQGTRDDSASSLLAVSDSVWEDSQPRQPKESSLDVGSITSLPYAWFQQQLMILEALQQAVVQSIHQVEPTGEGSFTASEPSNQDEQLRHVGCARLRAAYLNQAALEAQGDEDRGYHHALDRDYSVASSASASTLTAGSGWGWEDDNDEDEYYEDYASVLSRTAQATQTDNGVSGGDAEADEHTQELKLLQQRQFARGYASQLNALAESVHALEPLLESYGDVVDEFEYDAYADGDYPYENDSYEFTYDTSTMVDEDVDIDRELAYGEDKYPVYEYASYDDYEEVITLADAMLSKFELDAQEAEWADYLEQAYEYFTVYLNDDLYLSYSDSYDDADWYIDDAPNPVAVLASIAELVVWAHLGNFVLEVRPGYSLVQAETRASFEPETVGDVLVIPSGSYIDPAYAAAVFGGMDPEDVLFGVSEPGAQTVQIVNRFDTRLVYPDGSLNWELVSLVVLASGCVAMAVGFVVSWMSLRRSMGSRWVYLPPRGPGGKGAGGNTASFSKKGYERGGELGGSRPLTAADCHGAVCWGAPAPAVECASNYVSEKVRNESVAKALSK